jgi:hypothetical protein
MLLRVYAKRTRKADAAAANVIETLTTAALEPTMGPVLRMFRQPH